MRVNLITRVNSGKKRNFQFQFEAVQDYIHHFYKIYMQISWKCNNLKIHPIISTNFLMSREFCLIVLFGLLIESNIYIYHNFLFKTFSCILVKILWFSLIHSLFRGTGAWIINIAMLLNLINNIFIKSIYCYFFMMTYALLYLPTKSKRINAAIPGSMTEYSRGRK